MWLKLFFLTESWTKTDQYILLKHAVSMYLFNRLCGMYGLLGQCGESGAYPEAHRSAHPHTHAGLQQLYSAADALQSSDRR